MRAPLFLHALELSVSASSLLLNGRDRCRSATYFDESCCGGSCCFYSYREGQKGLEVRPQRGVREAEISPRTKILSFKNDLNEEKEKDRITLQVKNSE